MLTREMRTDEMYQLHTLERNSSVGLVAAFGRTCLAHGTPYRPPRARFHPMVTPQATEQPTGVEAAAGRPRLEMASEYACGRLERRSAPGHAGLRGRASGMGWRIGWRDAWAWAFGRGARTRGGRSGMDTVQSTVLNSQRREPTCRQDPRGSREPEYLPSEFSSRTRFHEKGAAVQLRSAAACAVLARPTRTEPENDGVLLLNCQIRANGI
jgi:hypothetical protein